jgi:site-specific DNA recombinase
MVASAPAAATGTLTAAEPVPVAVLARTSTLGLQDPVASVRRQLRSCEAWLPAGWFIAAVYSDVESGATDLEARSRGTAHKILTDAGLPRDGGMADLLAEAASPNPRFAVVVCEDIERSARDTFNALKLEKELSRQGIPLFATDEPADIAGVNATTVLVRRVKQGVAEWYRLQLKEKIWKGFEEHNAEGWNIGTPPYGYRAQRYPHPNPVKAGQGRTKTRLVTCPVEKTVVETIFRWRTVKKLGVPTIAGRLNADPAAYPPPEGSDGWTAATVQVILGNPKYTGHQVYGRRRSRNGRRLTVPAGQWLWTPEPVHDQIVTVETWKDAQETGAGHASSRDYGPGPNPAGRIYPYRSRVRCRDCQRRMAANPFPSHVYYRCPYTPSNPRHVKACPGHPRTVQVSESLLDVIVGRFFRDRLFTPGRAELLAAQFPASDTEATARRDTQAAALQAQIRKLETQQNAQVTALEDVPDGPAGKDMRARINARFAELHTQRTAAETQLTGLTAEKPKAADPALLDELPYLGDILPSLPPALKTRLLDMFDLTVTWNKAKDGDNLAQVTVTAVLTDDTLTALPEIGPRQNGYYDTAAPSPVTSTTVGYSAEPPITGSLPQPAQSAWSVLRRVSVDRRRERALFDDVGVHAFQGLAERSRQAGRQPVEEQAPDQVHVPGRRIL